MFFATSLNGENDPLFSHIIRWENSSRNKVYFSDSQREAIGDYNVYENLRSQLPDDFAQRDCLAKAQYLEMILFMSNYLLSSQGDRVAMAHSLEIRVPFLDHRIIEFMAKVSPVWKIMGLKEKYILKKYFRGILPDTIVGRRKHPYRAPIQQSLCTPAARDDINDHLSDDALKQSGLFNPTKVKYLLNKMYVNKSISEVDGMALAGIYSSQVVHSQYIKNWSVVTNRPVEPTIMIDKRNA